jgi:hypothetical protein
VSRGCAILSVMRAPTDVDIHAPEFPPRMDWLNVAFLRMDRLLGRHAVLVEFWDFARINSLRTLPYLKAWHERYADAGLQVIGVHSPAYSFGRDRDVVAGAVARLDVPFAVCLDPNFEVWQIYENRGWPGRYLFDRRGLLHYWHYGEGDYEGTELAVQEALLEIDDEVALPEPLAPLRPEDAPGALFEPQSADLYLPRDRGLVELVRDWTDGEDYIEAADAGAAASVQFTGAAAWAVLSGGGLELPGLYETRGNVVAEDPGLRLHGFQFTPALQPPEPS